jgi:hypothetical protein
LFINCCNELSYPLSLFFFAYRFDSNILLGEWLHSFVILPHLRIKGNAADPVKYCPISLTATMCCKIMEVIIKHQLVRYLVAKGLINRHQQTFISNNSTATKLLTCWKLGLSVIGLFLSSLLVALMWFIH